VVRALEAAGALKVTGRGRLTDAIQGLFGDATARVEMGAAALRCVAEHRGASNRQAAMLLGLLDS